MLFGPGVKLVAKTNTKNVKIGKCDTSSKLYVIMPKKDTITVKLHYIVHNRRYIVND